MEQSKNILVIGVSTRTDIHDQRRTNPMAMPRTCNLLPHNLQRILPVRSRDLVIHLRKEVQEIQCSSG